VTAMDNELLERFELKLAYLERANHELSDVVYRQQRELNELRARMQALSLRLAESSHQRPYSHEEERPPHY
jgi:SlyX protein